jgi:hypothetical protein
MPHETPVQPKLSDLLAGYLSRKAGDHAAGLASFDAEAEVLPYEAGPVQPIDAKLAWVESLVVAGYYVHFMDSRVWKAPPGWATLVSGHEPAVAVACALGNFPQMVRSFHALLQTPNLAELRPSANRGTSVSGLVDWAKKAVDFPAVLLALGVLRLAKQFDEADRLVHTHENAVPAESRTFWENEKAALCWHRGRHEQARDIWRSLEPIVPVQFNRGMADLFLGDSAAAQTSLASAVAALPEDGAWHHLGRLYLTLAQTRR